MLDDILERITEAHQAKKLSTEAQNALTHWLMNSAFETYIPAIRTLVDAKNWQELEDAFYSRVRVGTAGIRGPLGVGPNRINERTIGEAAQGLSDFIKSFGVEAVTGGVMVGHEVRLQSRRFAEVCCEVFAANGIKSYLFDGFRSTPELSFAVRHVKATAGVQITASHNPRTDNGFKFYWSAGELVTSPLDIKFMELVSAVDVIEQASFDTICAKGLVTMVGAEIDEPYLRAISGLSLVSSRSARIVFSPIHGAGSTNVLPILTREGFAVSTVPEQLAPDGNFPTAFGNLINPEFPEVMDMPKALAEKLGADIAFMSDPDADRLGVGVRANAGDNEIKLLNGNEVATLLTHFVLSRLKESNRLTTESTVIDTNVTTDLLIDICESFKAKMVGNLLVGFKFIGQVIGSLEREEDFVIACEESLGYLRGTFLRDKDASISALTLAEMASWLKDQDKTVQQYLDEIYEQYGYHRNRLKMVELRAGRPGKERIKQTMLHLRQYPPQSIGGLPVLKVIDRLEEAMRAPDKYIIGWTGDQITYELSIDGRTKVTARPSGNEPVMKFYVQHRALVPAGKLNDVRSMVDALAEKLEKDILEQTDLLAESIAVR